MRWDLELDEDDDCCDGDDGLLTERGRGGGDEGGGFKERGDDGLEGFWGWLTGDAIVWGWAIDCSACCEYRSKVGGNGGGTGRALGEEILELLADTWFFNCSSSSAFLRLSSWTASICF